MKHLLLFLTMAAIACGQTEGAPSLTEPSSNVTGLPLEPPEGQRCSGRNFNGRRCCTPQQPCGLGEGDCDGPLDGGLNDGHEGCKGSLVCGSNNCQKFGVYFHEKDDCCDEPSSIATERPPPVIIPGVPLVPPEGQRCKGRNYNSRRCCTPENPCGEGEGDCDGAGDGGLNDGDGGCKKNLVCGSNNCKQFGAYYHEKDDCCEKPASIATEQLLDTTTTGLGQWTQWAPCSDYCGSGYCFRIRECVGSLCGTAGYHTQERQERICDSVLPTYQPSLDDLLFNSPSSISV